jgi:hypothetical protein
MIAIESFMISVESLMIVIESHMIAIESFMIVIESFMIAIESFMIAIESRQDAYARLQTAKSTPSKSICPLWRGMHGLQVSPACGARGDRASAVAPLRSPRRATQGGGTFHREGLRPASEACHDRVSAPPLVTLA